MKMQKEDYEKFIELFTPPSDAKLLCCILYLYENGIKEFTQKDLSNHGHLKGWSIHFSLHRLTQKGIVRYKYTLPLRNGGRVKIFELNEQSEVVQKLIELFRVVVRGGDEREDEHICKIRESKV